MRCYTFAMVSTTVTLDRLPFDNHYARLGDRFSTRLPPAPLPDPYLVCANPGVAALLDLDPAELARPEFTALGSGNWLPPGADPIAMLYAGHQFGQYVPQLGDGRAILIGQVKNARGESWDLQLKGSGQTPYSRMADGRAVLRSAIREYLCSEALHHLGVPSTRALGVVGSDYPIFRETVETAAVLLRVAPSHVRFGSFEVFFYRNQHDQVRTLADYAKSAAVRMKSGSRTIPPTGTLPTKNASSPSWTMLSDTACVMLVAAIGSVPPRFRRTESSPPVSFWIVSNSALRPLTAVTVATALYVYAFHCSAAVACPAMHRPIAAIERTANDLRSLCWKLIPHLLISF